MKGFWHSNHYSYYLLWHFFAEGQSEHPQLQNLPSFISFTFLRITNAAYTTIAATIIMETILIHAPFQFEVLYKQIHNLEE